MRVFFLGLVGVLSPSTFGYVPDIQANFELKEALHLAAGRQYRLAATLEDYDTTFQSPSSKEDLLAGCYFPLALDTRAVKADPNTRVISVTYAGSAKYRRVPSLSILVKNRGGKWEPQNPGGYDLRKFRHAEAFSDASNGRICADFQDYESGASWTSTRFCFDGDKTLTVDSNKHRTRCVYELPTQMAYFKCSNIKLNPDFVASDVRTGYPYEKQWAVRKRGKDGSFSALPFTAAVRGSTHSYVAEQASERGLSVSKLREDGSREWTREFAWPTAKPGDRALKVTVDTVGTDYKTAIECTRTAF